MCFQWGGAKLEAHKDVGKWVPHLPAINKARHGGIYWIRLGHYKTSNLHVKISSAVCGFKV
jgi:hypothetical protein